MRKSRLVRPWAFWRDRRGIAAVEFALVLPVMILFSLGVAEVGRFALLTLKLQHAANTMADLASRDEELSLAAVQSMFSAMQHIVQPFDLTNDGVVIVSGVGVNAGDPPTVFWQEEGAGALDQGSQIGTAGGDATLPADLILRDGETVIVAEAVFRYTPWLMTLVPETLLRRSAFYRPRLGTLRELS
jgi:Flp pilus assembly protein TadG